MTFLKNQKFPGLSLKFLSHVETGACFVGELVVSVYSRFGDTKPRPQFRYKVEDYRFLRLRPRILGLAVLVEAADIADADARRVIAAAVRPRPFPGSAFLHRTDEVDNVVVAYVAQALTLVPKTDLCDGHLLTLVRRGTVQYDAVDFS